MKDLRSLLGEKKKIDPIEKEAKLSAVKGMRKMAGDLMADEMKGMQKVTVAAPDKESLKKGLAKAEDVLDSAPDMMEESEDESYDADTILASCNSEQEIDELMQKLAEKKAALKSE